MSAVFRSLTASVLCGVLVFGTGFAPAPADAPANAPTIETGEIGDTGTVITPEIASRVTPILTEAGIDPSKASIRVSWLDAETFHYAVRVSLDPELSLDDATVLATCKGCTSDELVASAVRAVEKALEQKQQDAEEAEAEGPTQLVEPEPQPPGPPVDQSPARRSPMGALGWGGVGALTIGVAGMATGGAFLGIKETRPDDDKSKLRDFQPSGYALLGVGGALVITGVALIVVDRVRAKRQSDLGGRDAKLRIVPSIGRQTAALGVSGRF